jgi:alkanesulfonate monooxygenase SsuD/methylene tetrahydromethanopterin reductase-like flavin-dependent oxidoreductase (luciferase family)
MKDTLTSSWITHPWVAEGQHTVRFGVGMLDPRTDWARYHDSVQMAEELGFDSYWTIDHPTENADCWTTLAALAVSTKTIRLGSIVSCISYRSPTLLARMAADVDRWSGGRLILGIGIGDLPWEFDQLGTSMPAVRERQQALEEAVHVVVGVWGEAPFSYHGQHFQVHEAKVWPAPVQQPHVPLLIAGGGERVTLRQVAAYADVCNFGAHPFMGSAFDLEDVRRKFSVLRAHCERLGRPYESVLRSYPIFPLVLAQTHRALQDKLEAMPPGARVFYQASMMAGLPQEVIAHFQALIDAGVQYFIITLWEQDLETLQLLALQVVPALTEANKGEEAW